MSHQSSFRIKQNRSPDAVGVRGCDTDHQAQKSDNIYGRMAQLVEHIVHIDGVTGSSPVATTPRTLVNQGFFHFFQGQIPQPYPNRSECFIECLHPVGAVPAHGFGHVGVFIQRERRGEMPHVLLHRFHIIAGPQR